VKIVMLVADSNNEKYGTCLFGIMRGYWTRSKRQKSQDWNSIHLFVGEDSDGRVWISKKSNVRRLKKQFGENNRNEG